MPRGVAPLDPTTDVGKLRMTFGDISFTPLNPPQEGFGDYEDYSDAELQNFLNLGGSIEAAMANIFLQMAGAAARESRTVKDFDLQVDLSKRAADLRAQAAVWQSRADELGADFFDFFPADSGCGCHAESSPYEVRGCTCGRLF